MRAEENQGADQHSAPHENVRSGTDPSSQKSGFSSTAFSGAKARSAEHNSPLGAWEDPIPLGNELLPAPPFDPEFLPEPLRVYVLDCTDRIQCPVDFVATSLVVTFSSIIGSGCAIRPHRRDNWTVVGNLWGGNVGDPGAKKTPAQNAGTAFLSVLERESEDDFRKKRSKYEVDELEIKLRKEKLEKDLKTAIGDENTDNIDFIKSKLSLIENVKPISLRRYKTADATVEKLQELLQQNPRGLLQLNDELIGFLVRLDQEGREAARAFFLESWNGWSSTFFQTDRIGRGNVSCNPCMSVFGGIQPGKLRLYLNNAFSSIGNDGLFQRFQLLVFPDRNKKYRLVDRRPDSEALKRLEQIAIKLSQTDFFEFGAIAEEGFPLPIFRFNPKGAQDAFHQWLESHEERLMTMGDTLIAQHLSKYGKLVPSIALIYYNIRMAAGDTSLGSGVDLQDVERAISFTRYLEGHARRVYSMVERRGIHAAKTLLRKIHEGELRDGFTTREVQRKGWASLIRQEEILEALEELVDNKWIRPKQSPPMPNGGRPSTTYCLHPLLKGGENYGRGA